MERITADFDILPSEVAEVQTGDPRARVLASARAKARDVARRVSGVIVAADTLVVNDGIPLGKPEDAASAKEMLRTLSGREHSVLTGLCILTTDDGLERAVVEETAVRFRTIPEDEIDAYVASGEPMGKAGAYAIQGRGGLFVEGIAGDFYSVMGLPLCRLILLLREVGVRV